MIRSINLNLKMDDIVGSGTTQATAAPLTGELNQMVPMDGDTAFKLPPCEMGKRVTAVNLDQYTAVIFPDGSDEFLIGGQPATAVSVPPGEGIGFLSLESQWLMSRFE